MSDEDLLIEAEENKGITKLHKALLWIGAFVLVFLDMGLIEGKFKGNLFLTLLGSISVIVSLVIVAGIFSFAGWLIWYFGVEERRNARRYSEGLCMNCGYSLTGLQSVRCPECGEYETRHLVGYVSHTAPWQFDGCEMYDYGGRYDRLTIAWAEHMISLPISEQETYLDRHNAPQEWRDCLCYFRKSRTQSAGAIDQK